MDLRKYYKATGGDYDETLFRLRKDELIVKFLGLFFNSNEFEKLEKAIKEENDEDAFLAAHTIKGNALNVGLGDLSKSSSELTECYRHGKTEGADKAFKSFCKDYEAAKKGYAELSN